MPLYAIMAYATTSRAENEPPSLLERLLSHQGLVSLGGYSFQVFLFQEPLVETFHYSLGLQIMDGGCANFVVYAVLLWLLSGLYFEYIETPFVAWLRKATVIGPPEKTRPQLGFECEGLGLLMDPCVL